MEILFLLSITIITTLFIGKNFFSSAKKNLFKDLDSWSGKDIKIKRNKSSDEKSSAGSNNYLKMIADESEIYLDDQLNREED